MVPRPVDREDPAHTLARDGITSLDELKAQTMRCRECPIGEFATQSVIGEGDAHAPLMLVGEQPGDQEDLQGHPFVGPAGKLLARALERAGIPPDRVFVWVFRRTRRPGTPGRNTRRRWRCARR